MLLVNSACLGMFLCFLLFSQCFRSASLVNNNNTLVAEDKDMIQNFHPVSCVACVERALPESPVFPVTTAVVICFSFSDEVH